jgi:hypothetical protein
LIVGVNSVKGTEGFSVEAHLKAGVVCLITVSYLDLVDVIF